jgi:peptide/nickel transport system substrate-binding protein
MTEQSERISGAAPEAAHATPSTAELTRRDVVRLAGAGAGAAAALALLGRGAAAPAGPMSAVRPAVAQDATPKTGGELRIGVGDEPDTMDPHRTEASSMWNIGWQMFDTMLISNPEGEIFPALFDSWEVSDDDLTYTFTLHPDVTFHDGSPWNAEVAKYNFDRIVDPATGSILSRDDLGPYASSEAVDESTLKVTLSEPYGPFLRMLTQMEFGVLPGTAVDLAAVEDFGQNPIGSGAFSFEEWVLQDHLSLVANPKYAWAPEDIYTHNGPPYLEKITFRFLPEAQTRIAALEAGELDAVFPLPEIDVKRLEAEGIYTIVKAPVSGGPLSFVTNANKFPTDDNVVRLAINKGLDRQQMMDTLYASELEPGYGPLTPITFSYWSGCEEINAFDLEGAKKMLEDAGWAMDGEFYAKDGQPLELQVFVFGTSGPVAEAFQSAIKPLGVDAKITVAPFTDQKAIGFEGRHNLMLGRFDAPDPRILRLLYHSENFGETGFMWTHFQESNPDLQEQLDAALVTGDTVTDADARIAAYTEAQQIIVENGLAVPIRYDHAIIGIRDYVKGWAMNDLGFQPRLYDTWLDQ